MKSPSIIRFSTATLALCAMFMLASHGSAAEKDTLDSSDVKFVKRAAASGMAEVKVAELGVKKAENADVKAFAQMIVTDHTKVNEELKSLAATKGVELSAVIDPKHADTFQKLEKSTGKEFDKELLETMVSSHKKSVSNFEDAAKDAKNADVKVFAEKTLPALKAHLDKAKELASK